MPSPTFMKVKATLVPYVGDDKAESCISRQLERCKATLDSFSDANFKEVLNFIIGASTIHVASDKSKVAELTEKLRAMAK